ncbi:hypothetical protein ACMU_00510 [Actibacterium mucosum KCTC 23349]|uniref:Cytochrome C n=2 Tax=Actibacterium TaxID=1433986 RepID=A0A037ZKQ0_9RHOB|nr:hypothetical protein ACMU_00510 [Actibacterium mucosum KCTC 23349]
MILGLTASAALAHSGVKNPAVQARMNAMMDIAGATKVLGDMAKGVRAFDVTAAQAAAAQIAEQATQMPTLFAVPENDPKSEAAAAIWQDFPDFSDKAKALQDAAQAAMQIDTPTALQASMAQIGGTCTACHQAYRITGK